MSIGNHRRPLTQVLTMEPMVLDTYEFREYILLIIIVIVYWMYVRGLVKFSRALINIMDYFTFYKHLSTLWHNKSFFYCPFYQTCQKWRLRKKGGFIKVRRHQLRCQHLEYIRLPVDVSHLLTFNKRPLFSI